MGQGLGLALVRAGVPVVLRSRRTHPVVSPLQLDLRNEGVVLGEVEVVLLATPDSAVADLAQSLADSGAIHQRHTVLHLSGVLGASALGPLRGSGAALGSFHPLQTVADPASAPERLRGAFVGIEGDEAARARGRWLAERIGLRPVELDADAKPKYHAGASIAANYVVALLGVAARLATEAGVEPDTARQLYLPLIRGAVENTAALGAERALTGPVRRGDVATVAAHLLALGPSDRPLYRALAREALSLSERAGLDPAAATLLRNLLRETEP